MKQEPALGSHKLEIDTPALLIDIDAMDTNIRRMEEYLKGTGAVLRPHVKTHKTPEIALRQLEAGAHGITCAKLGEAEVMAAAGIRDMLLANQVVGDSKIRRLMDLAERTEIIVAVDDADNVRTLGRAASDRGVTLGVIIEVNVGMGRCGVEPDERAAQLARLIVDTPGLEFRGLMGYEGHTVFIESFDERRSTCREANRLLIQARDIVIGSGIPVDIVSAGGTGTYNVTAETAGITEIQAGSYLLMDTRYRGIGVDFECALTVLATVISRPSKDTAILDVGRKGMSDEFGLPTVKCVVTASGVDELSDAKIAGLSEEHATLRLGQGLNRDLRVGEKVEVTPSHCCTTINLYDEFHCTREDRLEAVWNIAARGKMR